MEELKERFEKIVEYTKNYKGFSHELFELMTLKTLEKGYIEYTVINRKDCCNTLNNMHGGAIATLHDGVGAFAYLSSVDSLQFSVTINLNINYISGIAIDDEIIVKSRVSKLTKSLCFVNSIIEKKDSTLVSTAQIVYKIGSPLKSKL